MVHNIKLSFLFYLYFQLNPFHAVSNECIIFRQFKIVYWRQIIGYTGHIIIYTYILSYQNFNCLISLSISDCMRLYAIILRLNNNNYLHILLFLITSLSPTITYFAKKNFASRLAHVQNFLIHNI